MKGIVFIWLLLGARALACDFADLVEGGLDPSLTPLLAASELAVKERLPFGVEIEFSGSMEKVALALAARFGGTIDRTARIEEVQEAKMEKYSAEGLGWLRIGHERSTDFDMYSVSANGERTRFFQTFEEAGAAARGIRPELMATDPVETAHNFYALEKMNGYNRKAQRYSWQSGKFTGPGIREEMQLEEARRFMDRIRNGSYPLQSSQVAFIKGSRFGDLILKPERDGLWELATDHRTYQPPEAFKEILDVLYDAGASGTAPDTPVGVHVTVSSNQQQVPNTVRNWQAHSKAIHHWAKPHAARHKYIRFAEKNWGELNQDQTPEAFNRQLIQLSRSHRETDLNVYELATGEKTGTEVRLFNTEASDRLPVAIRLSLGVVRHGPVRIDGPHALRPSKQFRRLPATASGGD